VTTDIYKHFMQVVCYNGINISLIYFTSYQNFYIFGQKYFCSIWASD